MSEDNVYKDGDIVWVKLGNNWWPGEVTGPERYPEGLITHLKRVPYCVVKFFNENAYEYVRNSKQIFPFQCPKRDEFIKKGYSLYNSCNSFMEKFPADVEVAKQLIRRRETSFVINDRPDSIVKAILGQPLIRTHDEGCEDSEREKRHSTDSVTKILNITPNRNNDSLKSQQPKAQTCDFCDFTSVRLNVMILHRKIHSNRNSLGSGNSANKSTLKQISANSTASSSAILGANKNVDRNSLSFKNDINNKAKVSTILATKTTSPSRPISPQSRLAPANKTNTSKSANNRDEAAPISNKDKNNRNIRFTTPKNKSKVARNSAGQEKKAENAYAAILSDFCPSETETSSSEEKQSRRSLRHCKNVIESAAQKLSTVCIDLSESKSIQKIPKKREYSTLQMGDESARVITSPFLIGEPDVVCLSDNAKETPDPGSSADLSGSAKKDAEDIRRMLLADWSDEDETPADTNVIDESVVIVNNESHERLEAAQELQNSVIGIETSTPLIKSSTTTTARIRNIPKKDRRDVVLQDFNSDLSFIQNDNAEAHVANKPVAVDLDSSNSSIVEIIEEHVPPSIITINDDEEIQEISKIHENLDNVSLSEEQQTDSTAVLTNDKPTSTATSTSTLSCFDFQDDEDEHDNTTTTISHFKKKFLSGEKLQNFLSNTGDDLKANNLEKNRAELAERDQRLVADIETLLEQTQPTVVDLLNASSFEESLSVKDLPIKERGKRIFKSRNKTRLANTELSTPSEMNFSAESQTREEDDKCNTAEGVESPEKERSELYTKSAVTDNNNVEMATFQEVLISRNCLTEISSQQVSVGAQHDIPTCLEDTPSIPNEYEDSENSAGEKTDSLEMASDNNNASHNEQFPNENLTTSDGTIQNKTVEKQPHDDMIEAQGNEAIELSQDAQEIVVNQQQENQPCAEEEEEEWGFPTTDRTQVAAQEIVISEHSEVCPSDETQAATALHFNVNELCDDSHRPPSEIEAVETESKSVDKVKDFDVQIFKPSRTTSENVLEERCGGELAAKSTDEMITENYEKSSQKLDNGARDEECQNLLHKISSENVFKIRIKSPEQLLDQTLVVASQQDQELQRSVDIGLDNRLVSRTPTDENSSMGASDTGAEFGSPTSMLSEERLPAFRFQSNPTPQPEIDTAETSEPVPELVPEISNEVAGDISKTDDHLMEGNLLKNKPQNDQVQEQKSLLQRRYSMDLKSLQAESKSIKRQRLSVDDIAVNQENSFEKAHNKLLTIQQNKFEIQLRPKSRHMKITPRRNVSELFKEHKAKHIANEAQNCSSLKVLKETQSIDNIINTMEKEQVVKTSDVSPVNANSHEALNERYDDRTEAIQPTKDTSDNSTANEATKNKDLEIPTDHEVLNDFSEERQDESLTDDTLCSGKETTNKEKYNSKDEVQVAANITSCSTEEIENDHNKVKEVLISTEEKQHENLKSKPAESLLLNTGSNENIDVVNKKSISHDNIDKNSEHVQVVNENSPDIPVVTEELEENDENSKATPNDDLVLETNKIQNDELSERPLSPEILPSAAQDHIDALPDITLLPKEKIDAPKLTNQPLTMQEKEIVMNESEKTENQNLREVARPFTALENDSIVNASDAILIPANAIPIDKFETSVELETSQQSLDIVIKLDSTLPMPCTPREINIDDECENGMHIPSTPQAKDLIIECEPSTPQCIIECDHNTPAQVTPEKEVIIESDGTTDKRQDIIIEENLRLDDRETLLEREFQVIQPKESIVSIDIPQEPQTDADKAAEEFLIEFDSIVNHSHTVEEADVQTTNAEDALNADDLINNIIEEVHEELPPKEDAKTKSEPAIQFEPRTTYTVVANKNSWHQIFKESFNKQLINPAKRRQTICFEFSDTKEGVACKKQAFDIESVLPINKTIKRTAERKLTMPAIESKFLSSSQPHSILAFNHNQITLNTKLIPTAKRKLSIEDNITPFIIERPKQNQQMQVANALSGPPPLQRIRPLRRQSHVISKTSLDSMSEPPPPLQSHDHLLNDLFPPESSEDSEQRPESGRVLNQQIISGPTPTINAIHQNKTADPKMSMNKQIGVDSRGNKYVIIKTPPTDIVVQPTLTSTTTAATAPAANNFGTTITFQPLARASSEITITKPITKNKNNSKQQLQQQQMKQISITVPAAKSTLDVTHIPEISAKTALRHRRKTSQAKAIAAATATANSNINSAKHRQAMEALSRRLSIAAEAPPLSKISRPTSSNVQTQFPSNSNLSTIFGDAQISNIAQQQLIQLQQQHTIQSSSSPLPPPIILNKNAHQQSVIQRKARKLSSQQQTHLQHQQLASAKSSQLLQQHNSLQQQNQQLQPQIIAQIAVQQQTQHNHNPLQPQPAPQHIQQQEESLQQQLVQQSDGVNITTAATEDDDVIISNSQLIALPTQPYPGYPETFLLCKVKGNTCKPVDNVPLYLNKQQNELVPVPLEAIESGQKTQGHQIEIKPSNAPQQLLAHHRNGPQDRESNMQIANINCNLVDDEISAGIEPDHQIQNSQQHQIMEECVVDENGAAGNSSQICEFAANQELNTELVSNNGILLNIEGQQVLLDAATFAHLLANPDANTQLISDDGTEYVLTHEVLQALQMQQEQQQALELLNAAAEQQQQQQHQQQLEQTASNDIIAVALAGSDLYDNDVLTIDTSQGMQLIDGDGSIVFPAQTGSITQQHLTPPAVVTNAVLDQSPIMSTLEVPSSLATAHKLQGTQLITVPSHHLTTSTNAALGLGGRANLEDSLAAIGVTTQSSSLASSLGLPITVTNPNIASKVTSAGPLNEMLQFVSHRPATAAATAAAVAAAALAGEPRIFND